METIRRRLAEASRLHRAGRASDAEKIYREVLAESPGEPDALHLLGILSHQQGRLDEARNLLSQAVEKQAGRPGFHIALGRVLADKKQWDAAAAEFRRALSLRAEAPECCYLLGRVLAEAGKLEESVRAFEACVRLAPHHLGAWNQLGRQLTALERFDAAIIAYQAIAAAQPENRQAWLNIGNLQLHQRRFDEAESMYSRVIGIDPRFADGWYGIAAAHIGADRPEDAERALSEVLSRNADHVEALLALALIERDKGAVDKALARLQRAAELGPDHPRVRYELGVTLYLLGRGDEAAPLLRQAAGDPEHSADAWRLLAQMRRFDTPGSEEESAIRALLHDDQLGTADRAGLHFALGKICDERGDYREAFASFAAGNEIQHQSQQLDRDELTEFVDSMIGAFPPSRFHDRVDAGSDSELPVFVLGMPRSGTTLAEQIIRAHPFGDGVGEIKALPDLFKRTLSAAGIRGELATAVSLLGPSQRTELAAEYIASLELLASSDAIRVVDKLPFNFNYIGFIRLLFPRARIVHCVRDPLDNCLSLYFGFFNTHSFIFNDLNDIGFAYREYRRLMAHWETCEIAPIHVLRYESLVDRPEVETRSLLDFLGLDWDPGCLEFHEQRSVVRTLSTWQVREPIYRRSVGRWRHYQPWLEPLCASLGQSMPVD